MRDAEVNASGQRAGPNVVVVDPDFGSYKGLADSAGKGDLLLHFRPSGAAALRLAARLHVDVWLVAGELDDMSGHDFLDLLRSKQAEGSVAAGKVAFVEGPQGDGRDVHRPVVDAVFGRPVTFLQVEDLVNARPAVVTPSAVASRRLLRLACSLPIGVGAAVLAIVALVLR